MPKAKNTSKHRKPARRKKNPLPIGKWTAGRLRIVRKNGRNVVEFQRTRAARSKPAKRARKAKR